MLVNSWCKNCTNNPNLFDAYFVQRAQEIARDLRKVEFAGLTLSLVSLILAIATLACFRLGRFVYSFDSSAKCF